MPRLDEGKAVRRGFPFPLAFPALSGKKRQLSFFLFVGLAVIVAGWFFWGNWGSKTRPVSVKTVLVGDTVRFIDEGHRFSFALPTGWSLGQSRGAELLFAGPHDGTLLMTVREGEKDDLGFAFANFVRLHLGEKTDPSTIARNIHPISSDERKRYEVDSGYYVMILRKAGESGADYREHLIAFRKRETVFLFRFSIKDRQSKGEEVDTNNALFVFSRSFRAGVEQ